MGNYQFVLLKNVPKRNEDRSYVKFVCYAAEKAFICNLFFWGGGLQKQAAYNPVGSAPSDGSSSCSGACPASFQAIPLHF